MVVWCVNLKEKREMSERESIKEVSDIKREERYVMGEIGKWEFEEKMSEIVGDGGSHGRILRKKEGEQTYLITISQKKT